MKIIVSKDRGCELQSKTEDCFFHHWSSPAPGPRYVALLCNDNIMLVIRLLLTLVPPVFIFLLTEPCTTPVQAIPLPSHLPPSLPNQLQITGLPQLVQPLLLPQNDGLAVRLAGHHVPSEVCLHPGLGHCALVILQGLPG